MAYSELDQTIIDAVLVESDDGPTSTTRIQDMLGDELEVDISEEELLPKLRRLARQGRIVSTKDGKWTGTRADKIRDRKSRIAHKRWVVETYGTDEEIKQRLRTPRSEGGLQNPRVPGAPVPLAEE